MPYLFSAQFNFLNIFSKQAVKSFSNIESSCLTLLCNFKGLESCFSLINEKLLLLPKNALKFLCILNKLIDFLKLEILVILLANQMFWCSQ